MSEGTAFWPSSKVLEKSTCYFAILRRQSLARSLSALHGEVGTNYLRLLGADHRELFDSTENDRRGFAFVVRSMKIDYFKPALMDEVITAPQDAKGASITLHQHCKRGDDVLVEASVRVAFVSGGKAQPIPKYLRDAMEGGFTAKLER